MPTLPSPCHWPHGPLCSDGGLSPSAFALLGPGLFQNRDAGWRDDACIRVCSPEKQNQQDIKGDFILRNSSAMSQKEKGRIPPVSAFLFCASPPSVGEGIPPPRRPSAAPNLPGQMPTSHRNAPRHKVSSDSWALWDPVRLAQRPGRDHTDRRPPRHPLWPRPDTPPPARATEQGADTEPATQLGLPHINLSCPPSDVHNIPRMFP